jgi:hypothetical protein
MQLPDTGFIIFDNRLLPSISFALLKTFTVYIVEGMIFHDGYYQRCCGWELVVYSTTNRQPKPNADHQTDAPAKPVGRRRVKEVTAFFYY